MPDLRLPFYQAAAMESILQAGLATKMAAIDTEVTADTMVLRAPAAANYYRGATSQDVALTDTLPAIVIIYLGTAQDDELRSEDLATHSWELQYIETAVGVAEFATPQGELEERVSRAGVAIWQTLEDNKTLTVSTVEYSASWLLDRMVPAEIELNGDVWVQGISLWFRCDFGW